MTTDTKALAELILRHQARPSDDPYFWSPTKTEVRLSEAYLALLEENERLREERQPRFTFDNALAECPCCNSLDVGAAGGSASCYGCGLQLKRPTLAEVCRAWNTRNGIEYKALANHTQESDENKQDWWDNVDSYGPSA